MLEDKKQILNSTHTLAVVGLSASKTRPGYTVSKYMQEAGYRIIPVNPNLEEALGEKAYPDLRSVPEPVDMVLIFRRSEHIPPVVDDAIEIGAKVVWMQLGLVNEAAAQKARAAGLVVIQDSCIAVDHRQLTRNYD
ncbi:MAG: CoA-binding protein [Anaerolineae bacterium]|nr:CoA-binding protein [Anaerolineae bacterium]